MEHFWLFIRIFLCWSVYFALHSLLASARLKAVVGKRLPSIAPYYRLIYNALAIGLFGLGALMFNYRSPMLFQPHWIVAGVGLALSAAGGWMTWRSFDQYDLLEFIGLRPKARRADQLSVTGLNRLVRHPLYLATVLLLLGLWLIFPGIGVSAFSASVFVYLPFGIAWEEKKLTAQFGADYEAYCRRTSRLIPGIW